VTQNTVIDAALARARLEGDAVEDPIARQQQEIAARAPRAF